MNDKHRHAASATLNDGALASADTIRDDLPAPLSPES